MSAVSESRFSDAFVAAANFIMAGLDALVEGSRNLLLLGAVSANGSLVPASMRPWKGLQSKGANTGARQMVQIGKTWGGIKDIGATLGNGSLIEDFGRSLWMIGAGQPSIEGVDITGVTLSTILKVAVAVGGVYSAANTFTAGLNQPSAPDVGIITTPGAGFTGLVKKPISVKIARFRSSTGGRSRASTTSAVIEPSNQTFRITFPAAASGQDFWRVFVTQQGFGGVGLHFALPYGNSYDIAESAVAAGTAGGVARSLEFEFKDGDLAGGDLAYVDDFNPPAGTHAVRVGTCMNVLGCYGDSSTPVSSTSTGTVGACSLPNFYESYVPSHLLYFPEQIVTVLSREWDDHSFVVHQSCVTSIQYVGLRDAPACAVATVWSDIGFKYPHNVCQFFGRLFGMVAQGSLVIMDETGNPDYSVGAGIRDAIKDWQPQDTAVGFSPDTFSLTISNGGVTYSWSLENRKWSTPCYFADAGVSGSALSCVSSQGQMIVSVNNGGSHTAYRWDAGATSMPVTAVTNWKKATKPLDIYQLSATFDCDTAAAPLIMGVHANMRKTHARDFATTNASNVVSSASFTFDPEHTGDVACLFGANIGGAGVNYLVVRLTYASPTTATMTDPETGAPVSAQATLAGLYGIVAHDLVAHPFTRAAPQHTGGIPDFLGRDMWTHAISLSMVTNATRGQILEVTAYDSVEDQAAIGTK